MEQLTNESFSPPSRMAMDRLLTSMIDSITQVPWQLQSTDTLALMAMWCLPTLCSMHAGSYKSGTTQELQTMVLCNDQGIAESRGLSQQEVEAAMNEAPLFARRAVDLKILDSAQYRYAEPFAFQP